MNLTSALLGILGLYGGSKTLLSALSDDEEIPGEGELHRIPKRQVSALGMRNLGMRKIGGISVTTKNVNTIDQRVSYIMVMLQKSRTDPQVRRFAVQLLTRKCGDTWCIPEKDWDAEVIAIFNFVRRNIRYVKDPYGIDLFQHARRTLEWAGGDCDDQNAITLGALLLAVGYAIRLRVIQTVDSSSWNHIYLLCQVPMSGGRSRWVPLDASVAKPAGWEAPRHMIQRVRDYAVV